MNSRYLSFVLAVLITTTGCSSMKKTLTLGTASGAAAGALGGLLLHKKNRGKGAATGAVIGGALAFLSGYLLQKEIEDRDAKVRKQTLFNLDQYGVSGSPIKNNTNMDGITFPIESEENVPTHRKGTRVIEQHRVWTLSDDAKLDGKLIQEKSSK